ncbi:MAG: hypothetical protein ACFFBP_22215, partial [Promethearchaeota archaeon]
MEFIIGGYVENCKSTIETAINFFEKKYSKSCKFEGVIKQNYFFGYIRENYAIKFQNTEIFQEKFLFKSLYYHGAPNLVKENNLGSNLSEIVSNLQNDFIFINYSENNGLTIYVDKFAREKIYYTITPPFLFSNSLKYLISIKKSKKLNFYALTRFLMSGVIVGSETIFSNIKRLDIGEVLIIKKNSMNVENYWKLSKDFFRILNHDLMDYPYWMENIYEFLKDSVNIPTKEPV